MVKKAKQIKKKRSKFIQLALILIIVFNLYSVISPQWGKFSKRDYWERFPSLEKAYLGSQYVNKNPSGSVPDEIIFAYTGGEFIRGVNPILIIPDAPPIGKYMIGLSILLFKNEHIYSLFFGILSLVLLFMAGRQIFKNNLIALIPPVAWSMEPLFKNQFIYTPLFDTAQLSFILAGFMLINIGLRSTKYSIYCFILFSVLLGMFISTKFFMGGVVMIVPALFVVLLSRQRKRIAEFLITLPVSVMILLFSYLKVLSYGFNFRDIIGAQKWIFIYHQGQLVNPFSIFPLILINRWYVWWGDNIISSDGQWLVSWPIVVIASWVVILLYSIGKIKRNKNIEILFTYVIVYFMFYSVGHITSRYFIIIIPILYLITLFGIKNLLFKKSIP